jgi:tetratricopeptide (TPR) repeat protein
MDLANTQDPNFAKLDAEPLAKAVESYKKSLEFDPKKELEKKEYYGDIYIRVDKQYRAFFDVAVAKYNEKNFTEAMVHFGKAADIAEALTPDTLSLLNAALCAGLAKERDAEKAYYLRLVKTNYKSPNVYVSLSDIYLKEKDSTNAFKYIRMGLKEFPNNMSLFNFEINIYLTYNIVDKAMTNLKIAMAKDTSNFTIPFALGTLYDNVSNDTSRTLAQREEAYKNADKSYHKAIQIKPDYADAYYNLGAMNLNKAVEVVSKANNLPLDSTAANNRLKADAEVYLVKAAGYFEKELSIQPDEANAQSALRQIYTQLIQIYNQLNMPDKQAATKEKLTILRKK